MSDNIIRAIRAIVELGDYSFDAYELPDGERRIGFSGISTVLGYGDEWVGRLPKHGKKQFNAMQGMGYTGLPKEVEVWERKQGGASKANTLSLRDFNKIVGYEALKKHNERAIILLLAMAEVGFEQALELAFSGKSLDRILSKIKHYTTWTHDELMQAFADNREDASNLRLGM